MNPRFKDFFHFSSIERKGIIALLLIISAILTANELLYHFQPDGPSISQENMDSLLVEVKRRQDSINEFKAIQNKTQENHKRDSAKEVELFEFDPNHLSIEKWERLGLSKKQAEVIKNYEKQGGKFEVKSDVEKMYTVSSEFYHKLKPYILLPDSLLNEEKVSSSNHNGQNRKREWKPVTADINLSDSSELQKVYGLGPFFSGEIVSLREDLGGFHSKDQLLEIWNFNDSLLRALDSQLTITRVNLKKLDINHDGANVLKQHPYISWNVANSIVSIREQHGDYRKVKEVKRSVLISDSLFLKLSPYLVVDSE